MTSELVECRLHLSCRSSPSAEAEFIHRRDWTLPSRRLDFAGDAREKKPQHQADTSFVHWTIPGILID